MATILAMTLSAVLGLFGEFLLRKSSSPAATNAGLMIGAAFLCFGAMAPIWHWLYRSNSFVFVLCTYTPVVVVLYALMGILYFGDPLSPRFVLAGAFAFAAVITVSV